MDAAAAATTSKEKERDASFAPPSPFSRLSWLPYKASCQNAIQAKKKPPPKRKQPTPPLLPLQKKKRVTYHPFPFPFLRFNWLPYEGSCHNTIQAKKKPLPKRKQHSRRRRCSLSTLFPKSPPSLSKAADSSMFLNLCSPT
jgi:hypothetical protein